MDEGAARRSEFLAQADELIDALFADLQALRAAPPAAGRERRALLDRLFRHAHTLKGSASLLHEANPDPANPVTELAHELEDLLDAARARRAALSPAALDACEDAADALSLAVSAAARGETPRPAPPALVKRLRQLARGADSSPAAGGPSLEAAARATDALPEEIASALVAAERERVAGAAGEGARIVSIDVRFGLDELDEKFTSLSAALGESCETLATLPAASIAAPGEIGFRLLCATRAGAGELAGLLAHFGARVRTLLEPVAEDDATRDAMSDATPDEDAGESSRAAGALDTVRVSLAELDDLVFAADELFDAALASVAGSRARPAAMGRGRVAGGDASGRLAREEQVAQLRQKFHALSERVLVLRMQTLGRALERAARAARGAARSSDKLVAVELSGGAARLDRVVAERIGEPLAHLVRNAVAHGIETPAERRAAGKEERGRVRLAAVTEGARVRVTVSDDGRGIDLERIEGAAREQGLVAAGARVTEEQALRLIFRPGFSTAGRVSVTSGRGVGLDAVEQEIERAGGEVRVRTRLGGGTTFELRLPLALALVPVVFVRCGGQTYALDADQIADAGPLDPSAVSGNSSAVSGGGPRPTAAWRGRQLPFARLAELLKHPRGEAASGASGASDAFVVVRTPSEGDANAGGDGNHAGANFGGGDAGTNDLEGAGANALEGAGGAAGEDARAFVEESFVAVAVDEVAGRRDALVRSLGRHATRWRGTSGAIDLRDGTTALMLDLPRLLEVLSVE